MKRLSRWCVALAAALGGRVAVGAEFEYTAKLTGTEIAAGQTLPVEDDLYGEMAGNVAQDGETTTNDDLTNLRVEDWIRLEHHASERATGWFDNKGWTLTVEFTVVGWDLVSPSATAETLSAGSLVLDFDPEQPYTDEVVAVLPNGVADHQIELRIDSVTLTPKDNGAPPPTVLSDAFVLEASVHVERVLHLDMSTAPAITHALDAGGVYATLSWGYRPGAELYDLEYVYQYDPQDAPDFSRAVRVRLPENEYRVDLAYAAGREQGNAPAGGRLWYRVRAVGRGGAGFSEWIPGPWSSDADDHLDLDPFAPDINWQYGSVYAEDGRRVQSMTYVDGSGRARQSIALSSSYDRAIVSDTWYDYEGRPAVTALPAPDIPDGLDPRSDFYTSAGADYGPTLFDQDTNVLAPAAMDGGAGSTYYTASSGNPFHAAIQGGGTIPDAGGYPYTRTVYGPDGQPRMGSAPGAAHRLDGSHETETFHAGASAARLDALFGSEVGFADHYAIEATRDPNGQFHVRTTNAAGQVIATSLAGKAPDNLEELVQNRPETLTDDLEPQNAWSPEEQAWIIDQVHPVLSAPQMATFTYTLDAGAYKNSCRQTSGGLSYSYDCAYDLSITVLDEYGREVTGAVALSGTTPADPINATWHVSSAAETQWNFSVTFNEPGTYTIRKKLALDEDKLAATLDDYKTWLESDDQTCFEDPADVYPTADTSGCETSSLQGSSCDALYEVLKADLEPGGQYFESVDPNTGQGWMDQWLWGSCEPDNDHNPTCALDKNGQPVGSCGTCALWVNAGFLDGNGDLIVTWADYELWSPLHPEWTDSTFKAPVYWTNGATSLTQGTSSDPSFDTIVSFHPEYCHYEWCEVLEPSEQFDLDVLQVSTYASAAAWLQGSPVGAAMLAADPYFAAGGPGVNQVPTMLASLADLTLPGQTSSTGLSAWDYAATVLQCTTCQDDQWLIFAATWLALKQELVRQRKEEGDPVCYVLYNKDLLTAADGPDAYDYPDGLDADCPHPTAPSTWLPATNSCDRLIRYPDYLSDLAAQISAIKADPGSYTAGSSAEPTPDDNCFCTELDQAIAENGWSSATAAGNLATAIGSVSSSDVQTWLDNCASSAGSDQGQSPYPYDVPTATWTEQPEVPVDLQCWDLDSTCDDQSQALTAAAITEEREKRVQQELSRFESELRATCMAKDNLAETFTISYEEREYLTTLYYYDQSGTLVRTVAPEGAERLDDDAKLKAVAADRLAGLSFMDGYAAVVPDHRLVSRFSHDSLGQLRTQELPDYAEMSAGLGADTRYWTDAAGRLRASQNARQRKSGRYTYTRYDARSQPVETGETSQKPTFAYVKDPGTSTLPCEKSGQLCVIADETWPGAIATWEVTRTTYDAPSSTSIASSFPSGQQRHLRGRVASIAWRLDAVKDTDPDPWDHVSHYSYDELGNVEALVQEDKALAKLGERTHAVSYNYDPLSGLVNAIDYQPGKPDAWHHRYRYDADNRLVEVRTSADEVIWDRDAEYFYLPHGPLARLELGQQKVQGLDYATNLQGWLKGVNGDTVDGPEAERDSPLDLGADGTWGRLNAAVGRDAYGFTLGFYGADSTTPDDYTPVDPALDGFEASLGGSGLDADAKNQFGGNVRLMVTALSDPEGSPLPVLGNAYQHDQADRLLRSLPFDNLANNAWATGGASGAGAWGLCDSEEAGQGVLGVAALDRPYLEAQCYDASGNILELRRNGDSGNLAMDRLQYSYARDNGDLLSNRLISVADGAGIQSLDIQDIGSGAFSYDAIGELTADETAKIKTISWTIGGKVRSVIRDGSSKPFLSYGYDGLGNRVMKRYDGPDAGDDDAVTTWHVRDAQGRVLATYEQRREALASGTKVDWLYLVESDLYGAGRLGQERRALRVGGSVVSSTGGAGALGGVLNPTNTLDLPDAEAATDVPELHTLYARETRGRRYELTNHLGNVLETVRDVKRPMDLGQRDMVGGWVATADGQTDWWVAEVASTSDYYPFGMMMPGRVWSRGEDGKRVAGVGYRFGYNQKEMDGEWAGDGNWVDYGFRMQNPRLGRFVSVDPLATEYPWYTAYQYAGNKPVLATDVDGLEAHIKTVGNVGIGTTPPNSSLKVVKRDPLDVVKMVFKNTGGWSLYTHAVGTDSKGWTTMGEYSDVASPFSSYTHEGSQGTNAGAYFYANQSITSANVVNLLLGGFLSGKGPENIIFPVNGDVSKALSDALIVQSARSEWYRDNWRALLSGGELKGVNHWFGDNGRSLVEYSSGDMLAAYVGSARIIVEPIDNGKQLKFTIVNTTSIFSGDFWGRILPWLDTAKSKQRSERGYTIGASNTSQVFTFTEPMDQKMIKQYSEPLDPDDGD